MAECKEWKCKETVDEGDWFCKEHQRPSEFPSREDTQCPECGAEGDFFTPLINLWRCNPCGEYFNPVD